MGQWMYRTLALQPWHVDEYRLQRSSTLAWKIPMCYLTRCRYATWTRRQSIHLSDRWATQADGLFNWSLERLQVEYLQQTFESNSLRFKNQHILVIYYSSIPWSFFGAVSAISANDFQLINGYSNAFWGWGGEDDQLFQRTRSQNLTVVRAFDGNVSQVVHYKTMSHSKATPNPDRMSLINEGWTKFKMDGLVDLRYTRLDLKLKPLYTHIVVDIQPYNITT